ncbi:MAG TPA: hypothetical protein VHE60_13945 [Pyrinomonadaceae bacterium]|nr:hypothetical protein [Pyrinomonadaceae bacterium]
MGREVPASNSASAAALAATQAKSDSRDAGEAFIRPLVGRMQSNTSITDAQRQSLGITVRATTGTAVGAPDTKPVGQVDTSQRLRHTLSFVDELTPTSRAKPDGVQGCETWTEVGAAPGGPGDVHYLACSGIGLASIISMMRPWSSIYSARSTTRYLP